MPFRSGVIFFSTPSAALSAILSWLGAILLCCSGPLGQAFAVERQDCSPATIARNLQEAHAYQRQGDYPRSESALVNVLRCQQQSLPANDLRIAVTVGNLGELKRLQRQFRAAETLLKDAVAMHETAGGTAHLALGTSLLSLASVYKDRKQYQLAEPLVRRAMQILDLTAGPGSREAAAALNTLAVLHAELGDFDTAERYLRRAIARRQDWPPDVSTATVQYNMGKVLLETGRAAEAEDWLFRALELRSRLLGPQHPATRLSLEAYADLLRRTGRKEEARRIRAQIKQKKATRPAQDKRGPRFSLLNSSARDASAISGVIGSYSRPRHFKLP
jgi:tetratricopeptide (TPR) repeat protein